MPKKKIVLEPAGKDLKQFQAKYAESWRKFVKSDTGSAGLQFLRNRKLDQLARFSSEEIEKFGVQIAAGLQGYLQFENEVLNLSEMEDFKLPFDEPEVYLSPEQVAETQQQIEKFQEENRKRRYA